MTEFSELLGKRIVKATGAVGDDVVTFVTSEGETYRLYHSQDCCESVEVEEIIGDINDIVDDGPILLAEEVTNYEGPVPEYAESYTWTFYKLRTLNGDVTIRWLGESNGYYSESVYFEKVS